MQSLHQLLYLFVYLAIFRVVQSYINKEIYHNHQQLQQEVDLLLSDPRFTKSSCSQDQRIISINIKEPQAVISVLIVCNIHAREFFAAEVCLQYMKQMKENKINIPANYTIFYQSNLERERAFMEDFCLRTNENGVDLNRNYPTGFVQDQQNIQVNPGDFPLSEKFSQCLETTTDKFKPDVFLDIHTGEFSIYYSVANQTQFQVIKKVLEVCPNCRMRTEPSKYGMAFMDMKYRKNIQWSVLFEVFGGINKSVDRQTQCFLMFNPTSKKSYDFYLRRGTEMIEKFIFGVFSQRNSQHK